MRSKLFAISCLFAFFFQVAVAQSLRSAKDLIFAQVAIGGEYETRITVTNRGTADYTGTMFFYKGVANPWNPTVDGIPVIGGFRPIILPPGATRTLKVTGGQTSESGFTAIVGTDLLQNSSIEGNLTYFVKSGATLFDSIGVPPSTEFYLATIPFESSTTLALALVNRDPGTEPDGGHW